MTLNRFQDRREFNHGGLSCRFLNAWLFIFLVGGGLIIVLHDCCYSLALVLAFIFSFLLALALALATFARSIIRCSASAIFDLVTILAAMKASNWLSFLRAIGNCVSIISTLITS